MQTSVGGKQQKTNHCPWHVEVKITEEIQETNLKQKHLTRRIMSWTKTLHRTNTRSWNTTSESRLFNDPASTEIFHIISNEMKRLSRMIR